MFLHHVVLKYKKVNIKQDVIQLFFQILFVPTILINLINLVFYLIMSIYVTSVRNPFIAALSNHIDGYPTPVNFSYL